MIIHNQCHRIIGKYPGNGRCFRRIVEISLFRQGQSPGHDHHPYAVDIQIPQTGSFRFIIHQDFGIRKRTFKHFELRIDYRFKGFIHTDMDGTGRGVSCWNPGSAVATCNKTVLQWPIRCMANISAKCSSRLIIS